MDFEQLKTQVKEIGEIAESVPEAYREKCFEILLNSLLDEAKPGAKKLKSTDEPAPEVDVEDSVSSEREGGGQEDITLSSLHVKTKKFLESSGLKISHVNNLFYREGDEILPLYEDLGSTQLAETQIRIALLQAFRNALETGEFQFNGEVVREETKTRKAYDAGNFTANFNNNAALFDGFSKYDSKSATIKLSVQGKKRLADLVSTLAS